MIANDIETNRAQSNHGPHLSLQVTSFFAEGYRSLRAISFPVGRLAVFVGANGVGKTNLYRALRLLQGAAAGTLALDLATEGGMGSAFWAGARRAGRPARIRIGVELSPDKTAGTFGYSLTVGFPFPTAAAFKLEPHVNEEAAFFRRGSRSTKLLERAGPRLIARDEGGRRAPIEAELVASETALACLSDPSRFPDLHVIRQALLDWRFYHDLRTDDASPLRTPSLAVASPTLDSDGGNLAAVFATLAHIRGDMGLIDRTIEDAFPGAALIVPRPDRHARFGLSFPEFPGRVFDASELSDGALRYLALAGALLAYRPPAFVALNEPESSLHGDLLEPLARLIASAAQRTQIWVVTHSQRLAAGLEKFADVVPRHVIKRQGETWIEGLRFGSFNDEELDDD